MLEFEHLIQINDPQQPHIPPVGREELWAALVQRAKYPGQFNPAIQSRLEDVCHSSFVRIILVQGTELRDEVELQAPVEIRTRICAAPGSSGQQALQAESITRIEEPEPGYLNVRFIYRRDSANRPGELDVDEYLKSAYIVNDREAISMIREMLCSGWPDGV